jgi:AbrB family looped-hinge helix DNA binding protein
MDVIASTMNRQGRVVVPAPIRRAMGVSGPTDLLFRYEDGRLIVETLGAAVTDVQAVVAGFIPSERSLVDELIAERRAEAASE